MIGPLKLRLVAWLLLAAFLIGGFVGGCTMRNHYEARIAKDLREEVETANRATVLQLDIGRSAVALTKAITDAVSEVSGQWAAAAGKIRIEVEAVENETEGLLDEVEKLDEEDSVLGAVLPRSMCELEARSIGHDPDLSCAAASPD